ncbi:hypothetical protein MAHJHV47_46620 [Mycobacterium avium subsp. hominissuis]
MRDPSGSQRKFACEGGSSNPASRTEDFVQEAANGRTTKRAFAASCTKSSVRDPSGSQRKFACDWIARTER